MHQYFSLRIFPALDSLTTAAAVKNSSRVSINVILSYFCSLGHFYPLRHTNLGPQKRLIWYQLTTTVCLSVCRQKIWQRIDHIPSHFRSIFARKLKFTNKVLRPSFFWSRWKHPQIAAAYSEFIWISSSIYDQLSRFFLNIWDGLKFVRKSDLGLLCYAVSSVLNGTYTRT